MFSSLLLQTRLPDCLHSHCLASPFCMERPIMEYSVVSFPKLLFAQKVYSFWATLTHNTASLPFLFEGVLAWVHFYSISFTCFHLRIKCFIGYIASEEMSAGSAIMSVKDWGFHKTNSYMQICNKSQIYYCCNSS